LIKLIYQLKVNKKLLKKRKLKEANAARLLESDDEHDNNEINEPDEDEINHDIADDLINSNKITNDKLDKQDKKQKIVETTNWDNNDDMEFELSEEEEEEKFGHGNEQDDEKSGY